MTRLVEVATRAIAKSQRRAPARASRYHLVRDLLDAQQVTAGTRPHRCFMQAADLVAVQRIMRHQDLRITTEVYGHLAPGYLKREIDRLRFEPLPAHRRKPPVG